MSERTPPEPPTPQCPSIADHLQWIDFLLQPKFLGVQTCLGIISLYKCPSPLPQLAAASHCVRAGIGCRSCCSLRKLLRSQHSHVRQHLTERHAVQHAHGGRGCSWSSCPGAGSGRPPCARFRRQFQHGCAAEPASSESEWTQVGWLWQRARHSPVDGAAGGSPAGQAEDGTGKHHAEEPEHRAWEPAQCRQARTPPQQLAPPPRPQKSLTEQVEGYKEDVKETKEELVRRHACTLRRQGGPRHARACIVAWVAEVAATWRSNPSVHAPRTSTLTGPDARPPGEDAVPDGVIC